MRLPFVETSLFRVQQVASHIFFASSSRKNNKYKPHVRLPQGLHLLPTRLGHFLTGQLRGNQLDDDEYWTINEPQVNTLTQSYEDTKDKERWEKFWELETAGTEEFISSEKQIQDQEDRKVWEEFNKSIEKRTDRYYVCLSWKMCQTRSTPIGPLPSAGW
ncbi:LOW QUALITY PROTEIN: hypothetical protein V3C99_002003 [Haemonchus contortus]